MAKIAEGTSRELKAATGSGFLHVALADPARLDEAASLLEQRSVTLQRSAEGAELSVMAAPRRRPAKRLPLLTAGGIELSDFSMGQPSLEEVFFALTGQPGQDGQKDRRPHERRHDPCPLLDDVPARRPSALSNALVFGWRAVLKFKHVPEQLFDLVMTPIMFTLLFTFVFGGALAGLAGRLPAVLPAGHPGADGGVQRRLFRHGPVDRPQKGLFDRFRSLPIWPLAPFAGLMVGDILRHLIAATPSSSGSV
jgi:hypothetical protein